MGNKNTIKLFIEKFIISSLILTVAPFIALASVTDGTIDSVYKYAWGENLGWINFGLSAGNVHITDSALTGYAWSENYGWINLNPTGSGVSNDSEGNLSGYAWGENLGWINFNGVTINSSGEFLGYASTTNNNGRISFNCSNTSSCGSSDFKVKTDWRPASSRTTSSAAATSGGGGFPPEAHNPPALPYGVLINNGAEISDNRIVVLRLTAGSDVKMMAISNKPDFKNAVQEPYAAEKIWDICHWQTADKEKCPGGDYVVYVKFYTVYGKTSEAQDGIVYKIAPPSKMVFRKIIDEALDILEPILPKFLKPSRPEEETKQKPVEEIVSKEPPQAMRGKWNLVSYLWRGLPLEKFTLAPLPKEIRSLAEKFPELEKTFKKVGVSKLIDVEKLKAVKLTLPGLAKRTDLSGVEVAPGKFFSLKGVPIANLPPEIKQKLPSEIIFARTGGVFDLMGRKPGGSAIDFNIALDITDKGKPRQKISTIAGKPLQLSVKPANRTKSVRGYIIFKSKKPRQSSFQTSYNSLFASAIFANPVFAHPQEKPVQTEELLVLMEFEYTDPDADGIYTAEIQAPAVDGEYEIITVMDYEDPELGTKEIRLIAVVDPEGYVYEKIKNQELRITGAIVSLYRLNSETKQYELWPAEEYQQENPQITDITGKYAFLTPAGSYYLKIETPSYPVYESRPFQVEEGSGVHMNIELKTGYWWLKTVDWKTAVLILLIILLSVLLSYNFYRDKIRERKPESV